MRTGAARGSAYAADIQQEHDEWESSTGDVLWAVARIKVAAPRQPRRLVEYRVEHRGEVASEPLTTSSASAIGVVRAKRNPRFRGGRLWMTRISVFCFRRCVAKLCRSV